MLTLARKEIDFKKYISFVLIAYAFSFPVSKAATNLFEVLAILLWIIEGNWREKWQLYKTNLLSIAVFSLIGFSLLSIVWHGNAETTFRYVAKYRHLLVIFVFYSSFDTKYTKQIISAFLAAMFISELMSYAIFFEWIHYKNISPTDPSPFMSHMTYSTVLAFTISLLLVMLFYEDHLKYKLFYIFFFLSATINLFVNGGRSGQVIYIVLIFTVFLSLVKNKLKAFFAALFILLLTFSLAYNFSTNFHKRSNQLYNDIHNMVHNNDYSGSGATRVALSIIGINTIKDNFLLGTGIDYKMADIKQYSKELKFNPQQMKEYADYHSAFLTVAAQLGVVGIIISLLIIISLFRASSYNQDKEYKLMALLFALAFTLFSFSHNTLHTMNPMIFFALFGGFFNVLSKITYKKRIT
ncbi:O-antigen ligase family protein [Sulfurimonas sp. NWX79]|uniref:O-antigen ligase family protein n=1 Tax=Sulfurimonas sp. NWX79 TaxID=2925412 RepID=UPI003204A204